MRMVGQIMTIAGAMMVAGGMWWMSPAAGMIAGGLMLSVGGAVVYRQAGSV